jgi:hypothetical protein
MHALGAAQEFVELEAQENRSHSNLVVYASDQAHSYLRPSRSGIGLFGYADNIAALDCVCLRVLMFTRPDYSCMWTPKGTVTGCPAEVMLSRKSSVQY